MSHLFPRYESLKTPSFDKEHSNDPSMDLEELTIIYQHGNRSITYQVTSDTNVSLGSKKPFSLSQWEGKKEKVTFHESTEYGSYGYDVSKTSLHHWGT